MMQKANIAKKDVLTGLAPNKSPKNRKAPSGVTHKKSRKVNQKQNQSRNTNGSKEFLGPRELE